MRRMALAVVLAGLAGPAGAAPGWTFCVAAANGGADVWLSGVFAADGAHAGSAGAFKAAIDKLGGAAADARCPPPRLDRTVALDAQAIVERFGRSAGASVRAVPADAIVGGR